MKRLILGNIVGILLAPVEEDIGGNLAKLFSIDKRRLEESIEIDEEIDEEFEEDDGEELEIRAEGVSDHCEESFSLGVDFIIEGPS